MARVIVVEDDPDIATLVVLKMRGAGHDVSSEVDGEAGLAAVRAVHPDLVVLDWMMPRMNGLDVCRAIRQDPALADVKVLMLTAKAQEGDLELSFDAGADDYIQKPFSTRVLVARAQLLLTRP